jgi:hypothetical protein
VARMGKGLRAVLTTDRRSRVQRSRRSVLPGWVPGMITGVWEPLTQTPVIAGIYPPRRGFTIA